MADSAVLEAPSTQTQPAAPAPESEGPDLGSRMSSFAEKNPVSRTPMEERKKPVPSAPLPEKSADKPVEVPKVDGQKPTAEVPKDLPKSESQQDAGAPKVEATKPAEAPKPRLGELYRNERKEREALQAQHDALKKEVETLRSAKPEFDVTQHPDFVNTKKRAEELENEIRFVNYEKSAEFKEKYDAPYKEAWSANAARAQQFTVKVKKENELGEVVDAGTRPVTQNEFWAIVTADDNTAIELADKLFPDSPSKSGKLQLLAEEVRTKGQSLQKALGEARAKGAEREKQTQAQKQQQEQAQRKQAEERATKWSQIAETDRSDARVKELFHAADDDAKGKEILTKGFNAANRAFGILGDGDTPLEGDAEIAAHAEIYNKAAAFNYVTHKWRQTQAQIVELQKKLEEYEKSEPGPGAPKGGDAPVEENMDSRLEKFASGR